MVKSYSISVGEDDSKVDRFVALMVPAEPLPPREPQGGPPSSRCSTPLQQVPYTLAGQPCATATTRSPLFPAASIASGAASATVDPSL